MHQTAIFIPLFAMVALTFGIGILMLHARIRAVRQGLNPHYFRYNRGARPPDAMLQIGQHYDNLFELPVLFYVACLALYATKTVDVPSLTISWLYVASRMMHAYVHITHNRLLARRKSFLLSWAVLFFLWIKFMVGIY